MSQPRPGLSLDFVVYAGDPEAGAEALPSARAVAELEQHKDALRFDRGVYGAITVTRAGRELIERSPDRILGLVTKFVRALPYVFDGEPENALLSESDRGFVFERANDDVLISFFKGSDAFDPEELLMEQQTISLDAFATQILEMGDRMVELLKRYDPERYDGDDLGKSLLEFLELGRGAYRSFRLERERGVRR